MKSFPFTSKIVYDMDGNPSYDRAVDSIILRNLIKQYVTTGVFPNPSTNFQAIANTNDDMTVIVRAGACVINGTTGYETDDRELQVQASDSLDRIDTVVLRYNDHTDYRNIDLYVVKGTPASTPSPPTLERSQDLYELGLANLYIKANISRIPQERITDTRLDEVRCGYASFFTKIDTQSFYDQIQADLASFKNGEETNFRAWEERFMANVQTWFDNLNVMINQNDVVAINNRLDYVNNNYAYGPGIRFSVRNGALTITYDTDIWGDT